jgi:hypothetical protein
MVYGLRFGLVWFGIWFDIWFDIPVWFDGSIDGLTGEWRWLSFFLDGRRPDLPTFGYSTWNTYFVLVSTNDDDHRPTIPVHRTMMLIIISAPPDRLTYYNQSTNQPTNQDQPTNHY